MPSVTLPLRVARDDPNEDAIAFEGVGSKRVFDKKAGQMVEVPKWNWVSRKHIQSMESAGDWVNVTMPEWIPKRWDKKS